MKYESRQNNRLYAVPYDISDPSRLCTRDVVFSPGRADVLGRLHDSCKQNSFKIIDDVS